MALQLPVNAAAMLPWPTRHTASHDPEVDGYQIVLGNLVYSDDESDASDD